VFSWLLVWPLVDGARAKLNALARYGPDHLAYQPDRRLLGAAYGCTKTLLGWCAAPAMQALPPPEDGLVSLVGDSPLQGKRGRQHPVAHNTRLRQCPPSVFGFRIVLRMAQGDVSRIPVDVAWLRRNDAPEYQTETALVRQLLREFRRPSWGHEVVVTADAAYAAQAHLATIQALDSGDVMALPRTWKFANGTALNALVTHLPRWKYTQIRSPTVNTPRRRTLWVSAKRARRRHRGDGTVVWSTCRRHAGPKPPNILVTHLPETVTAREIVGVYLRRWWRERLVKALNGVVGLGQHQVTTQADRVERAVAVAIMASLLRLKRRAKDIPADRPWRALRLQRACAGEVIAAPCARSAHQMARKWLQMRKAA
jgi:hypothetical protein